MYTPPMVAAIKRLGGGALLLACFFGQPATAEPTRIVSLNVCTDQLLLALADPNQIAGLSIFAADPAFSFLAERAAAFPHDAADAETAIRHQPDLVVSDQYTRRDTKALLKRLGYPLLELALPETVDASIEQVRAVATLLGHPERGVALADEIAAARKQAAATVAATGARRVAAYERRGYVPGGATLFADLLTAVGWRTSDLAGAYGAFVPLEKLISEPPDYLLASGPLSRPEDQGAALLAHPALLKLFPAEKRLILPGRLTVCAGPSLPEAFRTLAAEAKRVAG
ncbi:MAG: ABC transporter substrate-binding protein [Bauldia sp.]